MTKRHWTIEEDRALKVLYPSMETGQIATIFTRDVRSVHNRAAKLKLKKTRAFIRELNTSISRAKSCTNVACE